MSIPLPFELSLETVGSCNRTCPTCLRNSYKSRGVAPIRRRFGKQERMPDELVYKVLDDAERWGMRGWLNMQHFNEPLQDPRLPTFLRYAKEHNHFSKVMFHSNGDLMTERKAKQLDGLADAIRIALYDEAGGRPMDPAKAAERMTIISSWFSKTSLEWTGGTHVITHFSPYSNVQDEIAVCRPMPCRREVNLRIIIDFRGEMLLCCDDIAGLWDLGNVRDHTLEELWNSDRHTEIVQTLSVSGGRESYGYCRICPRPDTD